MRLTIKRLGQGLHPSQEIVEVQTRGGAKILSVDSKIIERDSLQIGWPVETHDGHYLVQLPSPTAEGFWRVWVPQTNVHEDPEQQRKRA